MGEGGQSIEGGAGEGVLGTGRLMDGMGREGDVSIICSRYRNMIDQVVALAFWEATIPLCIASLPLFVILTMYTRSNALRRSPQPIFIFIHSSLAQTQSPDYERQ